MRGKIQIVKIHLFFSIPDVDQNSSVCIVERDLIQSKVEFVEKAVIEDLSPP